MVIFVSYPRAASSRMRELWLNVSEAKRNGFLTQRSLAPSPTAHPDPEFVVLATRSDPSRSPVAVYLSRLAPGSRRSMLSSLRLLAGLLAGLPVDEERF